MITTRDELNFRDFLKDSVDVNLTMDVEDVVKWLLSNHSLEDLVPVKTLESWAEDNGWTKEER